MRTVKRISGEVLGWLDTSFIVRDVVQKHNDGYLELYSQDLDLLHRRDELRRYFTTEINKDLFFYQDGDFGNIYIFNGNDLQDYGVIEGPYQVSRNMRYEQNLIIFNENDEERYYYLDQNTMNVVPTGFSWINEFNYTHNGYGIRYYNSCIYCYSLETKELVWKISTPEMQYDRGGRHMASATPDNDVPYGCYFYEDLLIAVFKSHSAGIDLKSGRIVWENNLGSFISSDFLDNGILYVNRFGLFYQLDASTGLLLNESDLYADGNILHYDITTDMVYNEEHIYFCMTRKKTLVTLRKDTFDLVSEEKIPDTGDGLLYANATTYLRGNKLFLTLGKEPLTSIYETLVYEV
ncbi:hypothetical protein [uncultured Acetobacteroides sp.]|uniref:hypothetical protein n=1 Tax=uncultured Acetobacteroides sp. TaxID=1760811 RepID=UPI0029F56590|nr:hypothetical protein [uncultured Acetobacteroides sp.]